VTAVVSPMLARASGFRHHGSMSLGEAVASHVGAARPVRSIAAMKAALVDDATWSAYRWIYRPMLVLQLALYAKAVVLFALSPVFAVVGGVVDPWLHENHLGNYSILASQPRPAALGVHLLMAFGWVGAVLFQKWSVTRMATTLGVSGRDYARFRRVHVVVGSALCVLALAGCVAGPLIAFESHGHPPMRVFLLLLPLWFLPSITTVWVTARRRSFSLRDHAVWANTAFLGPAVASLWAEALIYLCGRHTPLGPRLGELTGTGLAWALILALLVIPVWRARRRARSALEAHVL
jgi:hypothetical protein